MCNCLKRFSKRSRLSFEHFWQVQGQLNFLIPKKLFSFKEFFTFSRKVQRSSPIKLSWVGSPLFVPGCHLEQSAPRVLDVSRDETFRASSESNLRVKGCFWTSNTVLLLNFYQASCCRELQISQSVIFTEQLDGCFTPRWVLIPAQCTSCSEHTGSDLFDLLPSTDG